MTKQELVNAYQNQVSHFSEEVEILDKQLFRNSLARISVFLGIFAIIYIFWSWGNPLLIVFFVGVAVFLQLVKRHLRLQYLRNFADKMKQRNEIEERAQHKNFHDLDDGIEFNNGNHEYCNDIDLFGKGSFFQYINRTSLINGRRKLANLLKSNNIADIVECQKAIAELSDKNEWRQEFWAEAGLVKVDIEPEEIVSWISSYKPFIASFWRYVIYGFSIISVILLACFALELVAEGIVIIWFFVGLGISGVFVKKINELSNQSSKSLSTFQQYAKLLLRIESEKWKAPFLHSEWDRLQNGKAVASETIALFSKYLNALDQRSNIFVAVFSNGLFLRDIFCALRVEQWISEHSDHISNWFEVIDYFDVQSSLANFNYNHPRYHFPEIAPNQKTILSAISLGHPLLQDSKRVDNNFEIKDESFLIVTGANMAGKSTFLRTISLAIVMSNIGLPICSEKALYRPIKLVSSMRTSDSLTNDESYFFSELKRLRYIIDKIADDNYFIILDEILKGTNSVDKAAGSKKFVERLVRSHSTGIIATHDLSLCETADTFEEVENFYFDAEIVDDELFFDYGFKKGICQNMNASFLLRKMEII